MIKSALPLVSAMHIATSVFINDDNAQASARSGLHHDCEVWLEKLASHAPVDQPVGDGLHNRTGEDACHERKDRGLP